MMHKLKFIVLFLLSFHSLISLAQKKSTSMTPTEDKVIYVYDALCGWCYGFSPVITQLQEKYGAQIPFEVLSGGLVQGDQVGPMEKQKAAYIRQAVPRVEEYTGVKFSEAYLNTMDDSTRIQNSEPPARALCIVREMKADTALTFASALQKKLFTTGEDPNNTDFYIPLVQAFGLDTSQFRQKMELPEYKKKAFMDFYLAAQLKAYGFPALYVVKEGKYHKIAEGYTPFANLDQKINQLLKK